MSRTDAHVGSRSARPNLQTAYRNQRVEPIAGVGLCCGGPSPAQTSEVVPMQPQFAELVGIAAALASLYAAHTNTIIPLRVAAIAANALAMIYSLMYGAYPIFVLCLILLTLNAWRLHAMLRLIRDVDIAAKSDLNAD